MTAIWVYPGQGAQKVQMLHDLPQHPITQALLEQASNVLDEDVMMLDSAQALQSTRAVQLCLLIAGVISSELVKEQQLKPDYVAGLSIGAWAAATVAGVLGFDDALRLVSLRGRLMQEAYPSGYGMWALIGVDKSELEPLLVEQQQQGKQVYLANINAANQIVLSGQLDDIEAFVEQIKQQGIVAKKLDVSVPSHCELLQGQAEQLYQAMQNVPMHRPQYRYISGTTSRVIWDEERIMEDLAFNMCRTVDWESTVQVAWERGVRQQVEFLTGTVLTGLARKVFKDGTILSFQNTRFDNLILAMKKYQYQD